MDHTISPNSVRKLLVAVCISHQIHHKADEGASHPDRDAQFEQIDTSAMTAQAASEQIISVRHQEQGVYATLNGPTLG